jgi:hypothetical protein
MPVGGNANLGDTSAALPNGLETRRCTKCKGAPKLLTDFPLKKGEVPGPNALQINTCKICDDKKKRGRLERERRKKEAADKENEPPAGTPSEPEAPIDHTELSNLALSDFLSIIGGQHSSLKLEANVDLAPYGKVHTRREKAM